LITPLNCVEFWANPLMLTAKNKTAMVLTVHPKALLFMKFLQFETDLRRMHTMGQLGGAFKRQCAEVQRFLHFAVECGLLRSPVAVRGTIRVLGRSVTADQSGEQNE
jgi:hypothetical protein